MYKIARNTMHLEKFPIVFGWHLIDMNTPLRKEEGFLSPLFKKGRISHLYKTLVQEEYSN
jgi:hypothetical protein